MCPCDEDHLSTMTTAVWSIDLLKDVNAPLYKDHLSTEATVSSPLSGCYRQVSLCALSILCVCVVVVDRFHCAHLASSVCEDLKFWFFLVSNGQ